MDWLQASLGLVILLFAGDSLVRGAVNLSLRLGIPAMIVSLTIVAFGTSAPELLIAISAVLEGAPGLALGNVVGSNTANILLVLGIPAIISGLHCSSGDTVRNYAIMIGVTLAFVAMCFIGPISWIDGIILLLALSLMILDQVRRARQYRRNAATNTGDSDDDLEDVEGADPAMRGWKVALFLVLGLIGLPLGAQLLVESGVRIATDFGVSDTVIGLTLIAVGTSLPELATTVMAALRRNADVALGNVLGSNIFNLLAIIGVTSLVAPIPVDPAFLRVDLWVMVASSLLLAPFVLLGWTLTRLAGIIFTALYFVYIGFLLF
ncbi:calcium/sodium antiporter [Pseudoruegeria sp. SK021]|uniref:calcium/sodium antiporter n=1 Tax=Pseudoruegeria sp. SK021 TaxID=1933035 RepID=UPI002694DE7A